MSDPLRAIPFNKKLLPLVKSFDFGSEPYQQELGNWLRTEAPQAEQSGTRVWLYGNKANDIVGYGSIGYDEWVNPELVSKDVLVIPAVALRSEYWGQPTTAAKNERYSSQIMHHLIEQAEQIGHAIPFLGLLVHPENQAAIKLYERFDFKPFSHGYLDPGSGITYRTFLRNLGRAR